MSILDRLNLLVRANINDPGSRSTSSYTSTLRDMESSLRDARAQLAGLRNDEKHLVAELRAKSEKIDQWEERAILALKSGDEDLAKEAIIFKNQVMREAEQLREKLHSHRTYMRDMESSLEALQIKLDATKSRRSSQPSSSYSNSSYPPSRNEDDWDAELRRRLAQRQQPTSSTPPSQPYMDPSPFDTDTSFETMERMARNIAEMEARVDAASELSDDDPLIDPRLKELDRIFNKMESNTRTNDDLNALKRKFSDD